MQNQTIAEQYATVVSITDDGRPAVHSFIFGTNAVKSMIELASAHRALGWTSTLVGTDQDHFIPLFGESE